MGRARKPIFRDFYNFCGFDRYWSILTDFDHHRASEALSTRQKGIYEGYNRFIMSLNFEKLAETDQKPCFEEVNGGKRSNSETDFMLF